jgi:tRNA(Ile2) C34 agmatinyltransferase TiaS
MTDEIICPNCEEVMDWAGSNKYHCENCNTDIYEEDLDE